MTVFLEADGLDERDAHHVAEQAAADVATRQARCAAGEHDATIAGPGRIYYTKAPDGSTRRRQPGEIICRGCETVLPTPSTPLDKEVHLVLRHIHTRQHRFGDMATGLYWMPDVRWRACIAVLREHGHTIATTTVTQGDRAGNETGYWLAGGRA